MERSLLSFVTHHPNWEPSNQTASLYLSKAIGFSAADSTIHQSSAYHQHMIPSPLQRRQTRMLANSSLIPSHGTMPFGGASRLLFPGAVPGRSSTTGMNSSMAPLGPVTSSYGLARSGVHPHQLGTSSSRRSTSVGPVRNMSGRSQVAHHPGGKPMHGHPHTMSHPPKAARRRIAGGSGVASAHDRRLMMGVEAIDEEEVDEQPKLAPDPPLKKWEPEDDEDPFGVMGSEIAGAGVSSASSIPINNAPVGGEEGGSNHTARGNVTPVVTKPAVGNLGTMLNEVWNQEMKKW